MLLDFRNRPPKFLKHPNAKLKRIAEPVDFAATSRDQRVAIIRKMNAALGGVGYGARLGIAAPQIGINKRVIIVRGNVMFNPEWTPSKAPLQDVTEGCYSVPHKKFIVPRARYGWAKWTTIDGKEIEDKLNELAAIVYQHEIDHLDGICCVDKGVEIKEFKNKL